MYSYNDSYTSYGNSDLGASTTNSRSAKFYGWTTVEVTGALISFPV